MSLRVFAPVLAALLALSLLPAPSALGQQPPSLGAPSPEETAPAPTTTSGSDSGLKTWQQLLIFGAGAVLLAGIGFAIVSDARDRVGRGDRRGGADRSRSGVGDDDRIGAPHRHKQRSKGRARVKAKAARQQRRRNR